MQLSDYPPVDILAMSVCKAAFLADACTALSEAKDRYDISARGLEGLSLFLQDLEQSLAYVDQSLNPKEAH